MLLFVGLGNPGSQYEKHRHNVGFMALDRIVERHNFSTAPKRWQAETAEGRLGGEKIIAIKPQTYMNNSGQSVGEAMRFFKLTPADVVVFYDELDLAFGKIKVKTGGGAAGHNGIRSMTQHIGPDFARVRIGIGHPGDKARVHGHVLGDFAKAEQIPLEDMLDAIANEAGFLAERNNPRFMTEVARRLQPQRPNGSKKADEKTGPASKAAPVKETKTNEGPMATALKALMGRADKGDK
jgi:PTH1 family peptidyl-tRNA hydrolase